MPGNPAFRREPVKSGHTPKVPQAKAWWRASQGCYKAIQIGFCHSYHNKIINIQNRLPYSKVVNPVIIFFMSNGSKSWCWKLHKLFFQINQIAFWSSPLIHTVALKGHHYISFSLHCINFDLCEKILCDYVYIIILHAYIIILHVYITYT